MLDALARASISARSRRDTHTLSGLVLSRVSWSTPGSFPDGGALDDGSGRQAGAGPDLEARRAAGKLCSSRCRPTLHILPNFTLRTFAIIRNMPRCACAVSTNHVSLHIFS